MKRSTCPMCGAGVAVDVEGQVVSHDPVASCSTLATKEGSARGAPPPGAGDAPPRCCRYFMVGHTMYKGVYLPSLEEWAAHGYTPTAYAAWKTNAKAEIDRTGRLR